MLNYLKRSVGKILTLASLVLCSLNANANEQLGQELASCSGLMLSSSTFMTRVIGPQAAAANINTAKTAIAIAEKYIPNNKVQSISLGVMLNSGGIGAREMIDGLQKCNDLVRRHNEDGAK